MKKFFCFSIWLLSVFISCNSPPANQENSNQPVLTHHFDIQFKPGEIIPVVKCVNDHSKDYALYLPSDYDTSKSFPVIFFFDSHARGKLPLKKYQSLAEKYHFIFAGSNDSQNGMEVNTTQQMATAMMSDLMQRANINPQLIYTAGFSGGAKVACTAAFNNSFVKGAIACSTPFTEQLNTTSHKPEIFLIVGNQDFNMISMVEADNVLEGNGFTHHLYICNGKHEWLPEQDFEVALQWIQSKAIEQGIMKNNYLPMVLTPYDEWRDLNIADADLLKQEGMDEKMLAQYFTSQDIGYWKTAVSSLKKNIELTKEKNKQCFYARELNYVRMLGFIYSDTALKQNNLQAAESFLSIYQLADPDNHDVYFLQAVYAAKSGNNSLAFSQLKKAAQLGFSDLKMLNSESSLVSLQQMNNYNNIYSMIITNSEKE